MRALAFWPLPSEGHRVCVFVLQLYNEEILDLFDSARDPEARNRKSNIKIHEDGSGGIYTTGVTSRLVSSEEEVSYLSTVTPSSLDSFELKLTVFCFLKNIFGIIVYGSSVHTILKKHNAVY